MKKSNVFVLLFLVSVTSELTVFSMDDTASDAIMSEADFIGRSQIYKQKAQSAEDFNQTIEAMKDPSYNIEIIKADPITLEIEYTVPSKFPRSSTK